jgi:hypothetical protein
MQDVFLWPCRITFVRGTASDQLLQQILSSSKPRRKVLSQILLEFECEHRPDIIMLRAPQTAEMQ